MIIKTMPKCKVRGCDKFTRYNNTRHIYCIMHLARFRRHGHTGLQTGYHKLEKLPHLIVDDFIKENCKGLIDEEIVRELKKRGIREATVCRVKYRRRRLGIKKYLYGEIQKHKEWIRRQAIKKYGNKCELCGYVLVIEAHHILPKHKGGPHEINNLMVLCPNCHALITKGYLNLKNRRNIPALRTKLIKLQKSHSYLG